MASVGMAHLLNTQMNLEFQASNLCLSLSDWCTKHSLIGTAIFLRTQAQENITHMMRMFDYMKSAGANPVVTTPAAPPAGCSTLEELFEKTLAEYTSRCRILALLTAQADAYGDIETRDFLREMEKEHEYEGLLLQTIMDEVRNARKMGLGLSQTDRHLLNIVNYQQH